MTASHRAQSPAALHTFFLAIVPRIERHGRVYFHAVQDADKRDEVIAEMVALSWRWFLRLIERGKDATRLPSALATFAARAVWSGRRLRGQERVNDVLSPLAQRRHGFAVQSLPDCTTLNGSPLEEALADNVRSDVPSQVCFRMDFPRWRRSRSGRDQCLIDDLMVGERTGDAARKYGMSAGRISQLRRELHDHWLRFQDGQSPRLVGDARP